MKMLVAILNDDETMFVEPFLRRPVCESSSLLV